MMEIQELAFTHYRIDGEIGDKFTLQVAPLAGDSDEGILGIPGFGAMLPLMAMFGAAMRRLR